MSRTVTIDRLLLPASAGVIDQLASILVEAVEGGAAVSFLAPLSLDVARAWWTKTLDGLHPDSFVLVAREADLVVGTVQMHKAWAPNQPHRGEIAKLLVRASHRGSGVGRMLMEHAEDHARASGISLLTLDARQGGPAERLYQRLGWTYSGMIPGFAVNADRSGMHATVIYYKHVACSD